MAKIDWQSPKTQELCAYVFSQMTIFVFGAFGCVLSLYRGFVGSRGHTRPVRSLPGGTLSSHGQSLRAILYDAD